MLLLGITLTALAILYLLTTFALGVAGHLRHPIPIALGLTIVLALGILLMAD
jgi:hypothetical protein